MKTLRHLWILIASAALFTSCQKETSNDEMIVTDQEFAACYNPGGNGGNIIVPTLCSPKTVSLCADKTINVGTVTVGTGADGKVYITYALSGNWKFKELRLFAGNNSALPLTNSGNANSGQFPYKKTFYPYKKEYTFVLNGNQLSDSFTIAAYASVVSGGSSNAKTAWGDGCSGIKINPNSSSQWATKFGYKKGNCNTQQMQEEQAPICSRQTTDFFDAPHQWKDVNGDEEGVLTVGGYDYTEQEARYIYACSTMDAATKSCFLQVATLKLSKTDYTKEPSLFLAVTTAESWLEISGKLSGLNLPLCNLVTNQATNYVSNWITINDCGLRR